MLTLFTACGREGCPAQRGLEKKFIKQKKPRTTEPFKYCLFKTYLPAVGGVVVAAAGFATTSPTMYKIFVGVFAFDVTVMPLLKG